MSPTKPDNLRRFTSLEQNNNPQNTTAPPTSARQQHHTGSKFGLFFAATHSLSLPIERLLLSTILDVPGFAQSDPFAVAFLSALLPFWQYKLAVDVLSKQYRKFVESPLFGAPGLLTYLAARQRWVDDHIAAAVRDGATQALVLGGGFSTRSLRLAFSSLTWFEVDDVQVIARKRALLNELPALMKRHSTAEIPSLPSRPLTLLSVDWNTNSAALVPSLTAAGFNPGSKTVVIMEGLFPHLETCQTEAVLADVAALCAPGSTLLWDFLHADAFEGKCVYVGYDALAAACLNKGAAFRSGHSPTLSPWVRSTQKFHLRITELLSSKEIVSQFVRPHYVRLAAKEGGTVEEANDTGGCQMHACLAPKLSSIPLTIPVPEFYSLAAAVKTVPRISLKEAGSPVKPDSRGGRNGSLDDEELDLQAPTAMLNSASCFFRGVLTMIWGRDTSEENERTPSALPPEQQQRSVYLPAEKCAAASSYDLQKGRQCADWSLSATLQRGPGGENAHAAVRTVQPATSTPLDHAISIVAMQPELQLNELIQPPPPPQQDDLKISEKGRWGWFGWQ